MQLLRWIAVAMLASLARAQQFSTWYAIGPFDHRGGATSLDFAHPPESELKAHKFGGNGPALNAKSRGKNNLEITWKPLRFQPEGESPCDIGEIDVRRQMPAPEGLAGWAENAAIYLYRRIETTAPSDWTTLWNSDAPLEVWCDANVIVKGSPASGSSRFQDVARVRLEAGVHHLLVKLVHSDQPQWRVRVSEWSAPSGEALDQALERTIDGLMQRQRPDGSWSHEPSRDGSLSAAIAWAVTDLGIERDLPLLQLALESARVRRFESTEGAAWVALALSRSKQADDQRLVAECLTYLLDAQTSAGLWAKSSTNHKPDGPAQIGASFHALFALDALRAAGSKIEASVFARAVDGLDAFQGNRKLSDPDGVGLRETPEAEPNAFATILGLTTMHWLARCAELDPQNKRELEERVSSAQRWLQRSNPWKDSARRARDWNRVALCAFALVRARELGGLQTLDGFDVLARIAQEFVAQQRDDGLFQLGGARFIDEPLGLAVLIAARGPAIAERRLRRSELGYDDFSIVGSGRLDVRMGVGDWAPKIEREFGDRRLAVKMIEFFGVPTSRTTEAVALGRIRGGELSLAEMRQAALDIAFPSRGRWQVRARVVLEPEDSNSTNEGRILLSSWLTMRVDQAVTPEQLATVRREDVAAPPARGVTVEASSKFDGWPAEKVVDGDYATGWASKDDDREPWIKVTLPKPVKADGLRLVHAAPSGDGERWPRATKVELTINGKEHWTLTLDPEPTAITRHEFGATLAVRSIEVRVLEKFRPYPSEFVGFSEIELIPERK